MSTERSIFLFDVDNTLTKSRNKISPEMREILLAARKHVSLGVVSGSDASKILEQLGKNAADVRSLFDWIFTENGVVSWHKEEQLAGETIGSKLGEEHLQAVLDFCLVYIAKLRIPIKRGTFIEYRKGMINVSPIGRNCSQAERDDFAAYDAEHKVRERFVQALQQQFPDYALKFSIGGQISIDIFPIGWDKTYCLRFLADAYDSIHFFGDRTEPGGNDHEIYIHPSTIGHAVQNPEHTKQAVVEALQQLDTKTVV